MDSLPRALTPWIRPVPAGRLVLHPAAGGRTAPASPGVGSTDWLNGPAAAVQRIYWRDLEIRPEGVGGAVTVVLSSSYPTVRSPVPQLQPPATA